MPRAGLTQSAVILEAARLTDAHGVGGLTLAALADNLGVRIPSLYKHVDGMPAIQHGIMVVAKRDLSAALARVAVGKSRDEAITALAFAYREWALAHPGQYGFTVHAPVVGDEADEAVSAALLTVIFDVLAGYNLRSDDAIDATRFFRAALHGFVSLETAGGFGMPADIERSFARTVQSVITALTTWSSK